MTTPTSRFFMNNEVDEKNPKYFHTFNGMEDVREKYGDEVCHELRRVTIDLVEVNGSGRYPTLVPWIKSSDRKATAAEVIKAMERLCTSKPPPPLNPKKPWISPNSLRCRAHRYKQ